MKHFSFVVLLVFLFAGLLFLSSCQSPVKPDPLTPARDLVGTWKSAFPIKMTCQTDFGDFVHIVDVATMNWDVTWVITQNSSDEHKVNITMTFSTSNYKALTPDNGYVPEVSPIYNLEATISGASITINKTVYSSIGNTGYMAYKFNGSFTTSNMMGTWKSGGTSLYYSGEYSGTNLFKLYKK